MAYYILKRAYERGDIHPGDLIAEATSGNTGISFASIGSYLGHPVTIYMPDWMLSLIHLSKAGWNWDFTK